VHRAFRALKYRNFRLFFFGQFISLIGTWMQNVAMAWLVYRLTGSSELLGIVAFCGQIPVFLFSLLGGYWADRHSRYRTVLGTQTSAMLLAFVLSALTLPHLIQVWQIITLAILLGLVNAFDIPARQSLFAEMVSREDLINAIALNSSIFNGARIIGPAVAGVLVALIGEGWCFFGNAVSYLAVIAGLSMMKLEPRARRPDSGTALENIKEGVRFVFSNPPVRDLLLLVGLISIAAIPYAVLMPIFADRILGVGARGLGMLMGGAGVGALAGALTLAARREVRGLGRMAAGAAALLGVALIAFSFSRVYWLSIVLLVPVGFATMLQMGCTNTLVQSMTPDHLRGRVMSFYATMFMGMAPIGSLLAGLLAAHVGAPITVAIGGGVALLGSALFAVRLPRLRVQGRQLIEAQRIVGSAPPEVGAG
jgi:MFS family permease